ADRAVASLKELAQEQDKPFFLAVGFIKPHSPYIAPKKYWNLYDPEKITIAGDQALPEDAPRLAGHGSGELRRYTDQQKKGNIPESDQRKVRHAYYACTSYIDAQIGRVLTELKNQGLEKNTIVALWSDHGYHLGEHGLWGKTTNYELDTRVALMIRKPGAKGNGQSCQRLIELVDLFPTLAEAAEIDAPSYLEGSSFLPLLDDPQRAWKPAAFSQFTRGKVRGYSIRTENHRFTEWINTATHETVATELYEAGAIEKKNIAAEEPALAKQLSDQLGAGHGWKQVRRDLESGLPAPTVKLTIDLPFSSHMVLPRNQTVHLTGTAKPKVTVAARTLLSARKGTLETNADANGRWSIPLTLAGASTDPRSITITCGSETITLENIVVGDVWLASGQSNMRFGMRQSGSFMGVSNYDIRLFDMTGEIYPDSRAYDLDLLRTTDGSNYYQTQRWQRCMPDTLEKFSAVAYHFAHRLWAEAEIPIGIIHNAIGGSPMQSWIPESVIAADPVLRKALPDWLNNPNLPSWTKLRARQNLKSYFAALDGPPPHHPFEPGFLYQAGITPFADFPIKGVIWYQGESDATQDGTNSPPIDPVLNKHTFITLINSWRSAFKNPTLPFYFVQLPGLNRNWPLFREMQREVSEEIPHTGMAVTMDVGHPTNVHPTNKRPVGERLANLALADVYKKKMIGHSPRVIKRGLNFLTYDQELKTADGKAPREFKIAGEDKEFHQAKAKIENNIVRLSSDQVPTPKAIRYAWANNPDVNLISTTGLPVSPFRTDHWTDTIQKQATPKPKEFTKFGGSWHNGVGLVELDKKLARSGGQCVHLLGDVEFTPEKIEPNSKLEFWAERWTSRSPFSFRVEAKIGDDWKEIHSGDKTTKVGRGFTNHIVIPIPTGSTSLRFKSTAPKSTGVLIDDLTIAPSKPMKLLGVNDTAQVNPIAIGRNDNPLLEFIIRCEGDLEPKKLSGLEFRTQGATTTELQLTANGKLLGSIENGKFAGSHPLTAGDNQFSIIGGVDAATKLGTQVDSHLDGLEIDGKKIDSKFESSNSVGFALRQSGQDNTHTYRIPGIATTNQGTLIAVYDNRYRSGGDLPGDIDVGMSRSSDGGQSWEKMRVIMDMGNDPRWRYDGVGDPAILVDKNTGTIWVAATWSHGNRSWNGSGPGMKPEETGQFMLSKSDDDGLTWSEPINITGQIKDPKWRFVLQGPGNGITLQDGTIVFPAQYRAENAAPNSGKPFSTIIYSKDHGQTWKIGSGVKIDTTEAQVVQLGDGSIMINCRDNRGGSRSVYTTNDLGETWQVHPSSRKALIEPVCNADLMRVVHKTHGPLLIFSNPNTTRGRNHFTLKVSRDEGLTWPEKYHHLYDARGGGGYSTLTQIDEDHIGVLYEGLGGLYFLKYSLDELLE
ncbi:MAG: sialidase-1, partial [Verrucomicrobiales bacterium]